MQNRRSNGKKRESTRRLEKLWRNDVTTPKERFMKRHLASRIEFADGVGHMEVQEHCLYPKVAEERSVSYAN